MNFCLATSFRSTVSGLLLSAWSGAARPGPPFGLEGRSKHRARIAYTPRSRSGPYPVV